MSDLHTQANNWVSIRLAVGSAIFIAYAVTNECIQVHYIAYLFVRIKKNRKAIQTVEELSAKMYLVGLAGLLSMNYYQAGIAQTVFAYLVLLALLILNASCVLIDSVDEKIRCYIFLGFYALLFAWYLAIIIDYFVVWG